MLHTAKIYAQFQILTLCSFLPLFSIDCKHIYDKDAIISYIRSCKATPKCPVAGMLQFLCTSAISFHKVIASVYLSNQVARSSYK